MVETDEELIPGVTIAAYRRVLTVLHIPAKPGESGLGRAMTIDPECLDAALKRDVAAKSVSDDERIERTARERAEFEGMEFAEPPSIAPPGGVR
jgi:hypothetical protein